MEIGTKIITLKDKITSEGLNEIKIPKGTVGTICEIYDDSVLVEIWGKLAPKNICGVFDFEFDEIKEFDGFSNFGLKK